MDRQLQELFNGGLLITTGYQDKEGRRLLI
jgi:hypothetical protein